MIRNPGKGGGAGVTINWTVVELGAKVEHAEGYGVLAVGTCAALSVVFLSGVVKVKAANEVKSGASIGVIPVEARPTVPKLINLGSEANNKSWCFAWKPNGEITLESGTAGAGAFMSADGFDYRLVG